MNHFNTFAHRVLGKTLFGAAMLACAVWSLAGMAGPKRDYPAPLTTQAALEWPQHWQGQPVRPLALSAVEQRFAQRFPGRMARLTDGRRIVVLRDVHRPTRMLHPAADCYRALGYRIESEQLETAPPRSPAARGALPPEEARPSWVGPAPGAALNTARVEVAAIQRCFVARKGDTALRVCEQIEDAQGQHFADTSAWYWAAVMGQSTGPWRAVTVTSPWLGGST
ncbi:hypothetical protein [Ottowia sp.]|uniref:hypothetical protein n=1 Tax=Ottowia sp. TaxID=1898956 RepID=UPI003A87FEF2